jgi:hypothetical protein
MVERRTRTLNLPEFHGHLKRLVSRIIVVTIQSEPGIYCRDYLYIVLYPIRDFYIWCKVGVLPGSLVKVVASLLWHVLQQKHMFRESIWIRHP